MPNAFEKILIENFCDSEEKNPNYSASIGLATYPTHTQDKEKLLKLADDAMYLAKRTNRNVVQLAITEDEMKKAS